MTPMKKNQLPPALIANLQGVLAGRKDAGGSNGDGVEKETVLNEEMGVSSSDDGSGLLPPGSKPIVLVTNGDGIESLGILLLVEALVRDELYDVYVCAPESDKSSSGHSVSFPETVAASSVEINGAVAFAVSGTPADCVSLAFSGALFPWSRPALVISGINKGTSCGRHIFYSGAVAGAREALMSGIPSLSISLNLRKDENQESNFKDAVDVCLPLIRAAIRDADKGSFLKGCLMNIEIPGSPSTSKTMLDLLMIRKVLTVVSIVIVGGNLIPWKSKNQTIVAISSTKAEYIAMTDSFYGMMQIKIPVK